MIVEFMQLWRGMENLPSCKSNIRFKGLKMARAPTLVWEIIRSTFTWAWFWVRKGELLFFLSLDPVDHLEYIWIN